MSNDSRQLPVDGEDAALIRDLQRLGPLLRRREETDDEEPDAAFVATLEARLVAKKVLTPLPMAPATPVRSRQAATPPHAPARHPGQRRPLTWRFALAAMVAVVVIGVLSVVVAPLSESTPRPSASSRTFNIPTPTGADLVRGYPHDPGGAGGRGINPISSLIDFLPGVAYGGPLSVIVPVFPNGPRTVTAYRLAPPSFTAARAGALASSLGIPAAVRREKAGGTTWLVDVTGYDTTSPRPLRSVAVDAATGEVLYHDTTPIPLEGASATLPIARVVSVARAWLSRLGWPGARMPVQSIAPESDAAPGTRVVAFGWAGVGAASVTAATLWEASNGRIVEARLWPPVEQAQTLPARSISASSADVRGGKTPMAVSGVVSSAGAPGAATATRVSIVSVLTVGQDGLYLVPAYRFSGTAVLRGSRLDGVDGAHPWYTLTSATGS